MKRDRESQEINDSDEDDDEEEEGDLLEEEEVRLKKRFTLTRDPQTCFYSYDKTMQDICRVLIHYQFCLQTKSVHHDTFSSLGLFVCVKRHTVAVTECN